MKIINIMKWTGKDQEENEVKEDTIQLISIILNIGAQKENLVGFENMRKIYRISKALDEATDSIKFEEVDWTLIVDFINKYTPAIWGKNQDIIKAIEEIKNPKEE